MPSLSSWMTFTKKAFALQTVFILKYYSVLKLRNLSIKDFTNWTLPKSSWGAFKNWPFVLQACTTISYHTIALSFSRGRRLPSPPDPRLLPQPRPRHGAQARPPTHSLRRSAPPDPQSTWVPPTPTAVRVPGVRRVVPCRVTVSLGPVEHSSISSQDPPPHTLSLEWTSTCWWPSMRPELGVRLCKGICVASVYLFPSSEKTSRLLHIRERIAHAPDRRCHDLVSGKGHFRLAGHKTKESDRPDGEWKRCWTEVVKTLSPCRALASEVLVNWWSQESAVFSHKHKSFRKKIKCDRVPKKSRFSHILATPPASSCCTAFYLRPPGKFLDTEAREKLFVSRKSRLVSAACDFDRHYLERHDVLWHDLL